MNERDKAVEFARAQIVETLSPLLKESQRNILEKMLRSENARQRATARGIKKQQRKIKVLRTRVDDLTSQKRAIMLNLFREYEIKGDSSSPREIETLMMLMANLRATEDRTGHDGIAITLLEDVHDKDIIGRFLGWAGEWKKCAFARLSVGAKLGAALMLTEAPDEVVAPWDAWSLCVPDGIITSNNMFEFELGSDTPISSRVQYSVMRLWCYGTEPIAAIGKSNLEKDVCFLNGFGTLGGTGEAPWMQLARNFVKGACLSLSIDIETHRNKPWGGPKGSKRAPGVVPDAGVDYLLSGSVAIDLRDEVKRICEGRKATGGHTLTVQFLVRGHWRNQAVGIKHQDRKRIWIEPFWKGPEESRVLLRTHRIKTDGET